MQLGACVSDVLMTLRNTEQANQYGRHCVHSGARHVLPRVIASGNVSAASESAGSESGPRATRFTDSISREVSFLHAGRSSEVSANGNRWRIYCPEQSSSLPSNVDIYLHSLLTLTSQRELPPRSPRIYFHRVFFSEPPLLGVSSLTSQSCEF